MGESGIYVLHILDPDTEQVIILSIDRRFAHNPDQAVADFKREFPWVSNWPVKAKPTWLDEQPQPETNLRPTRQQAGFLRRSPHGNH